MLQTIKNKKIKTFIRFDIPNSLKALVFRSSGRRQRSAKNLESLLNFL
jgi:hypothetical protein